MASPEAVARLRRWREEPCFFLHDCLGVEPDAWQADAFNLLPHHGGVSRIALKACAGPGKSALLAWAGWWFLSTQGEPGEHPKGIALSVTADNLRDNLWPELSKWRQRSPFLNAAFESTKERIFAKDHPDTWFLAARSFARSADASAQASSLSGLHSKYIFYLLDESGDMLPAIGRAAEQGLAGATVGMAMQAGNPTSLSGLLAESATKAGVQTVTITADPDDPKRTPRVPVEWAREQIATYGRDNPWVMSYILGKFPPGGINTLIGLEEVQTAMRRNYHAGDWMNAAKLIGVDVARFGDDSTEIIRRQGLMSWPSITMRGATTIEIANRVALEINEWKPDGTFIDGTGGYGAGVIDQLRSFGHQRIHDVQFAGKPDDPRFANKRMEMWWEMTQWIKQHGAVAPDDVILRELTAPTYGFNAAGRMLLESKEDMKKRGVPSPNKADALCMTWAAKVIPQAFDGAGLASYMDTTMKQRPYNPLGKVGGYGR